WARRKTRASFVCFTKVSKVGRASSGKRRLRVRIGVLSTIKYYKNMKIHCYTWCSSALIGTTFFRLKFPRSCSNSSTPMRYSARGASGQRSGGPDDHGALGGVRLTLLVSPELQRRTMDARCMCIGGLCVAPRREERWSVLGALTTS